MLSCFLHSSHRRNAYPSPVLGFCGCVCSSSLKSCLPKACLLWAPFLAGSPCRDVLDDFPIFVVWLAYQWHHCLRIFKSVSSRMSARFQFVLLDFIMLGQHVLLPEAASMQGSSLLKSSCFWPDPMSYSQTRPAMTRSGQGSKART